MKNKQELLKNKNIQIVNNGTDGMSGYVNLYGGKVIVAIIASCGGGWEHVSVSLKSRCPTWQEMCFVKEIFFDDDETVVQYHPSKKDYINNHDYCLHMWRPINQEILKPPKYMI